MVGPNMAGWLLPAHGKRTTGRSVWRVALGAALLCLTGCEVTVASGVDEVQANRTVVALRSAGIVAEKTAVAGEDQRFAITVARGDAPGALQQIVEQRLLDREPTGLLDAENQDVLVKSRALERAELARRLAGEIEHTLLSLDEVATARVHLTLSSVQGRDVGAIPPRASVLLRTRGASPLSEAQVKTLMIGAVSELNANNIEVVTVPAAVPANAGVPLTRIGPITLTAQSAGPFRAFALGLIGLNLALLGICSGMWWRWRKNIHEGT